MKKYYGYIFVLPAIVYVAVAFAQGVPQGNMPFFMPKNAMKNQAEKLPSVESMRKALEINLNSGYENEIYFDEIEQNNNEFMENQKESSEPIDTVAETEKQNFEEEKNTEDQFADRPDTWMLKKAPQVTAQKSEKQEVVESSNNIDTQVDVAPPKEEVVAQNDTLNFGFSMNMDLNKIFNNVLQEHENDLLDIKHGRYSENKEVQKVIDIFHPHEYKIYETIYPQF